MMMFSKLFLLSLVSVVRGSMRYAIDRRSCNTDELFDKVKYLMESSKDRARLVADLMRPHISDPDNHPLGDRINDKLNVLFGASNYNTIFNLYSKYSEIQSYVWIDVDVWSDDWINERDFQDVQLHCNADYVQADSTYSEPNIHNTDTVQWLPIEDKDPLLDLKDPKSTLQAVASPAKPILRGQRWPTASPEVITFNPEYLKTVLADNVIFNTDRINKAIINSLVDRIKDKFDRVFKDVTNIDILITPEAVMMHEVSHLMVPGNADDTNYPKSYGWVNCVKLKEIKNADSIAFFALTVDLIQQHNIDVDQKGKLHRFT